MKIVKFRIKNFKSIRDSGECYLDERITVLAGRNESGKTSVVEALEDFNMDRKIREDAKPIWDDALIPEVTITIELGRDDWRKINEKFGLGIKKSVVIDITKQYPAIYRISKESLIDINPELNSIPDIQKKIRKLLSQMENRFDDPPINDELIENPRKLINSLNSMTFLPDISENLKLIATKKKEEIIQHIKSMIKLQSFEAQFINVVGKEIVPNFILFSTFEDILPNQIQISQSPQESIIQDLCMISGLDFNKIQPGADPGRKERHKDALNLKVSEDYRTFWGQDHSNLYISWDSEHIFFWIKEGGQYYRPAIRSKGRQWHLSFYIRVTARSLEDKRNSILIDEPGLFLHARAQKDILKKLEECAKKNQIIYTTHSPYLIQPNKLNRLRLVIKDDKSGTKIKKITARADKETLTPILTAIGEDLSAGIRVDKKDSIVVEGYSDYLYFNAFKRLLDIGDELNFVPAVGAGSAVYVGSILFGWGLDPIFILDNDGQGENMKKKLIRRLSIPEDRIILLSEKNVESLFSDADFKNYIQDGVHDKGKVLLATEFFNRVENRKLKATEFSKETKDNFRVVFKKLKDIMK